MTKNKEYIKLAGVSALTAVIWLTEQYFRGWEGMIWLRYFHFAIPLNFLVVLLWFNYQLTGIKIKQRILLNLLALITVLACYILVIQSIYYTMIGGPMGMMIHFSTPEWVIATVLLLAVILIAGLPLIIHYILRLIKIKTRAKLLNASIALYIFSLPIGMCLLVLLSIGNSNDITMVIKSGLIFPLLTFSLGILPIGAKNENLLPTDSETRIV